MRTLLYIILIICLSCESPVDPDSSIITTWTWIGSSGGFAGQLLTPDSTGDQITIELTTNRYKKYVNSVLTENLKYKVNVAESIYTTDPIKIITYGNGWKQSYLVRNDTLVLRDECYDCFIHEYIKN